MTVEPASAAPAGEPSPVVPAGAAGYDLVDFHVPDETAALIKEAVPENTLLAYRSRWRSFEGWCREAGRVALPVPAAEPLERRKAAAERACGPRSGDGRRVGGRKGRNRNDGADQDGARLTHRSAHDLGRDGI